MTNQVFFPGLNLSFNINRVAFSPFGLDIYWYGLIIASGLLLAVFLCGRWGKHYGITEDQLLDMVLIAIPVALVAVRVYYVVFNLDIYRRTDGSLDWGAILSYRDGGLAIYGAIISSFLVLLVFCRVKKLSFLAFADLGVHGLLIGQSIGRWGNFTNVEAYGSATTLPWRMCSESIAAEMLSGGHVDQAGYQAILTGELGVHPTFFYESLWNFLGLLLLLRFGRRRKFDGQCFLFYVAWYGFGRTIIEGLRTDSLYFFGMKLFGMPIRTSQLLAAVSCVVAVVAGIWLWKKNQNNPSPLFVQRLAEQNSSEEEEE